MRDRRAGGGQQSASAIALSGLVTALILAGCATPAENADRGRMIADIRTSAADVPPLANDPVFLAAVAAEARLPREAFVPREARPYVYLGTPLQIGWDQTISDPYIMAVMTAAAKVTRGSNVLEIGTGSGYQAALLAELGARVSTIEIVPELATRAAATLKRRGYRDIAVRSGDGFAGWPEHGPFDAIIVTAGSAKVPQPLLDQLKAGGRLVMPVGVSTPLEHIQVHTKRSDGGFDVCSLGWAMFVPLTGRGRTADRLGLMDRSKPWCYGKPVT